MERFVDKVVLVTGAAGGIGSAAAARFAGEGARLVLADRDGAHLRDVAERIGGAVATVTTDVGEPDGAAAAVRAAGERFGRLDAVFNNAGVSGPRVPVHDLDVAAWDEVIRVNLRGMFLVLRAAVRAMIAGGAPGAVVNMSSSMAGWDVLEGGSAYAASKHGVMGLTRTAALDAAPYDVRVNAVCPGVVETALGLPAPAGEASDELRRFEQRIPLRRIGQPEDVAAVVAFLASDEARHVTGAGWLLDGGQTLQSWSNAPEGATYARRRTDPSSPMFTP